MTLLRIPTGSAARVLAALQLLAHGEPTVEASYNAIAATAERSRPIVAKAIAELISTGWVTQTKGYGKNAVYSFVSGSASSSVVKSPPVVKSSSSVVNPDSSSVVKSPVVKLARTTGAKKAENLSLYTSSGTGTESAAAGTQPAGFETEPEREPEREPLDLAAGETDAIGRARQLLREFFIGEPTQTELAKALESRFEETAPAVRKIGRKTLEDARRGWVTNPVGLTVTRIRKYLQGEQLSFLQELGEPTPTVTHEKKAKATAQASARRGPRGKGGRTFRRGQTEYTDERRAAAEEEARQRLAERESRKVATS